MREFISPDSIAVTVRMLRSTFHGTFLLVEGDVDARFMRRFVDQTVCHVQSCLNRSNVIRIAAMLDKDFLGHLGMIDRDHSDMLNEEISSQNIVMMSENDLELMLFQSDALERFIAEYASADKVNGLENEKRRSLRDIILDSAGIIGSLRYLSKLNGWNLQFQGMTYRFSARHQIDIDIDRQLEHLRGRSTPTTMPTHDDVKQSIRQVRERYPALPRLACGHDVCEVVARGIHSVFGRAHVALGRGGAAVEEVLRAAFTEGNMRHSSLFAQIRVWETERAPLRVFPK